MEGTGSCPPPVLGFVLICSSVVLMVFVPACTCLIVFVLFKPFIIVISVSCEPNVFGCGFP